MQVMGSKRIRSTAYHPIANGFIERLHCQLKASLKSQPNLTYWVDSLPLVLLNIRTALKDDIHCMAAELVYGTSLRLPREFFDCSQDDPVYDPAAYVSQLQSVMQRLKPIPVRPHSRRKVYISKALATCTHVFVCHDAIRKPFQALYDGPYKVLQRTEKYFAVDVKGKQDTISLDRLKVAHLDKDNNNTDPVSIPPVITEPSPVAHENTKAQPTARVTRSGRKCLFSSSVLQIIVHQLTGGGVLWRHMNIT